MHRRLLPGAPTLRFRSALAIFAFAVVLHAPSLHAATPSSGSLSNTTPSQAWAGGIIAGTNLDESTCVEGLTCDTYRLILQPGTYVNKRIAVGINWLIPTDDYDLYINKPSGAPISSSTGGAPSTSELAIVSINNPVVATPETLIVHVVCFTVTPGDMYTGLAQLANNPSPRTATYLSGPLRFSQNVALKAPVTVSDGEPSCRVDVRGNCYVSGIRGVPAGVDLWRFDLNPASPTFDPGMQSPTYLGQPDAFVPQNPQDPTTGGADGGGDIDIATSFPADALATPVVTMISLAAANISSAVSTDRGQTFTLSPATAVAPADDREWSEADGASRVYMLYRAPIPATGLFVQRSDDNGITYPMTSLVSPSGTTPGYIDVDHNSKRVYVAHIGSSTLFVANSSDSGATWKNNTVDNSTGHGTLFDVVKVGDDGTVYAVWSDQHDVFLAHSTDGGFQWSGKVRVSDNSVYKTNLMPWLECGSAGRVDVVWYASTSPVNNDAADWVVMFSQSTNASAANPAFRQEIISDHIIHGSNISLGGLTGAANRNLIDYFQVAIDPQGAAVVAFTDDHNDYTGHTFVTRQLDGTSLYATANGTGMVAPAFPPPLPAPDPSQPEVMDYLHDATTGLLQPIPADNPYDLLYVDYSCEDPGNDPMLVAVMKVSSLAAIPAGANWRVSFTANAANGVSDRGDQFYMIATTDSATVSPGAPLFQFGTAVRQGNGGIAYTVRGLADFGGLDQANGLITLKVKFSKLNPFVTHGPPIGAGSVLHGLRGSSFSTRQCTPDSPPTACAQAFRDQTRGGTSYTVPACGPTATLLSQFVAEDAGDGIRITWQFGAATDVVSSSLERAEAEVGPFSALDAAIDARDGMFTVVDKTALEGRTYFYRIAAMRSDGSAARFGPINGIRGVDLAAPLVSFLGYPAPNPASGRSEIQFRIGRPGFVEMSVFDVNGRRVRSILATTLAPGLYTREWDGMDDHFHLAADGVYFILLNTADRRQSRRIVMSR